MQNFLGIAFQQEIETASLVIEASKIIFPNYPSAKGYYGLISRSGQFAVSMSETYRDHFSDGLSVTASCDSENKNCKYGFQDQNFKWAINPNWRYKPLAFKEGYSVIFNDNQKTFEYIDKSGKIAFAGKKFLSANSFNFGYARVALRMNGQSYDRTPKYEWGWLSKTGEIFDFKEPPILESEQNVHLTIREGMIPCPKLDADGKIKWGYRNLKGDWVISPQYFSVVPFYFGKAFVQTVESYKLIIDAQFILINSKGDNLFPENTFRHIQLPNHLGLGALTFMPPPGESFGKTYLYNWKSNKKTDFSVLTGTRDFLWEDDWIPATEYKDLNGNRVGIGAFYDENFNIVLDRVEGKYIITDSDSFSENASYVGFYDPNSSENIDYAGYMDKSGKILFYFDRKKLTYPKPYMKSGHILITKFE